MKKRSALTGKFLVAAIVTLTLSGCFKSPEEKSAEWLKSGRASIERKNFAQAAIELLNALKETPEDPAVNYELGIATLKLGNPAKSLQYFNTAADLEPTHADAHLRIAEILNATNDAKLASTSEEHARAALELRPQDPDILQALAVAEGLQGKTQDAIGHLRTALAIAPLHLKSTTTLAFIQWSLQRNAAAAEQTLRDAVERSSNSPDALVALARFLLLVDRVDDAEREFQRAIAADGNHGEALMELANLQESRGQREIAGQTFQRLAALPDQAYRVSHAKFLFRNGEKDAAVAELKQLAAQQPDDLDLQLTLVDLYLQVNALDDAGTAIDQAFRKHPGNADVLERQSQLYVAQKRFQEAEATTGQALERRPESANAHYWRAQAYLGLDRPVDHREELERVLELDPSMVRARIELSQSLRASGAVQAAFNVIDAAPAAPDNDLALLVERISALFALGRHADAAPHVQKALSISRTPETLMLAGRLALYDKKNDAGRALLEESLKAAPDHVEALNTIALSLAAEGRLNAAVQRVREQAARVPKSAPVQLALGTWLEQTGDRTGASAAYAAALSIDSKFAPAGVATARMKMLDGRGEEARGDLNRVLAANPRNVNALLALGMLEEASGHRDGAIEAYRRILGIDPEHVVAKNNLSLQLVENPATSDEALLLAQALAQAASENAEIADTVGWVYYKKGLYTPAVRLLERAAAGSRDARTKYHLAIAYYAAGQPSQGRRVLAEARALNPNLPEAKLASEIADRTP